jgi:hypothetical protein
MKKENMCTLSLCVHLCGLVAFARFAARCALVAVASAGSDMLLKARACSL